MIVVLYNFVVWLSACYTSVVSWSTWLMSRSFQSVFSGCFIAAVNYGVGEFYGIGSIVGVVIHFLSGYFTTITLVEYIISVACVVLLYYPFGYKVLTCYMLCLITFLLDYTVVGCLAWKMCFAFIVADIWHMTDIKKHYQRLRVWCTGVDQLWFVGVLTLFTPWSPQLAFNQYLNMCFNIALFWTGTTFDLRLFYDQPQIAYSILKLKASFLKLALYYYCKLKIDGLTMREIIEILETDEGGFFCIVHNSRKSTRLRLPGNSEWQTWQIGPAEWITVTHTDYGQYPLIGHDIDVSNHETVERDLSNTIQLLNIVFRKFSTCCVYTLVALLLWVCGVSIAFTPVLAVLAVIIVRTVPCNAFVIMGSDGPGRFTGYREYIADEHAAPAPVVERPVAVVRPLQERVLRGRVVQYLGPDIPMEEIYVHTDPLYSPVHDIVRGGANGFLHLIVIVGYIVGQCKIIFLMLVLLTICGRVAAGDVVEYCETTMWFFVFFFFFISVNKIKWGLVKGFWYIPFVLYVVNAEILDEASKVTSGINVTHLLDFNWTEYWSSNVHDGVIDESAVKVITIGVETMRTVHGDVCDTWCYALHLIGMYNRLLIWMLYAFIVYYYMIFLWKTTRSFWTMWWVCMLLGLSLTYPGYGAAIVSTIVFLISMLTTWARGVAFIDCLTTAAVYLPWCALASVIKFIYLDEDLGGLFGKFDFAMQCFSAGICVGAVSVLEMKTTNWGTPKVILTKDGHTGRVIAREVVYGLVANFFFGVTNGDVTGVVATCANMLEQTWMKQRPVVRRYASTLGPDGMPTREFVKTIVTNAQRLGKLQELVKALNDGDPIPEETCITVKKCPPKGCTGVILTGSGRCDFSPSCNGFIVRVGNKNLCMTNAHGVCRRECAQKVFAECVEGAFEPQPFIMFDNGERRWECKVVSWSAKSDMCLLLPTEGSFPRGYEPGPLIVGKTYIWHGVAPPLRDPLKQFWCSVAPNPNGVVFCHDNEFGDSGSILLDNSGRVCAMKYGVETNNGAIGLCAFFVPMFGMRNMHVLPTEKICSTSLIDMQQAAESGEYQRFCQAFCETSEETWDKMKEAFDKKDEGKFQELLAEFGKMHSLGKSVTSEVGAKLILEKGRRKWAEQKLSQNETFQKLLGEHKRISEEIHTHTLLLSGCDDEIEERIKERLKELQDEMAKLQDQIHRDQPQRKEIYKQLGLLGQMKSKIKAEMDEMTRECIGSDEELRKLKKHLGLVNGQISKVLELMSGGRQMWEELVATRMPGEIKKFRYPFWFQHDGRFVTYLEKDICHESDRHPTQDIELMSKAESYGFTSRQWRRKLTNGGVSYEWYMRVFRGVEPTTLWNNVIKNVTNYLGGCPFFLCCQFCGLTVICDKKLHVGCSGYLTSKLLTHMNTCPMNSQDGNEVTIGGVVYERNGKRFFKDGKGCGHQDPNHVCVKMPEELGEDKRNKYYCVKTGDGVVLYYVSKKCIQQLRTDMCPTQTSSDEITKLKLEMDSKFDELKKLILRSDAGSGPSRPSSTVPTTTENSSSEEVQNDDWVVPKKKRKPRKKRVQFSKEDTSADEEPQEKKRGGANPNVGPDKHQLFLSNVGGKHEKLVPNCNCPRCVCRPSCECVVCTGCACIWCAVDTHSTQDCDYAKTKTCNSCGKPVDDWYGKCMYDPQNGKHGTNKLCCSTVDGCFICGGTGHHPLSCPVVRRSTLSKPPDSINCHGLNRDILKTMCVPGGGRGPVKKQGRDRVFQ